MPTITIPDCPCCVGDSCCCRGKVSGVTVTVSSSKNQLFLAGEGDIPGCEGQDKGCNCPDVNDSYYIPKANTLDFGNICRQIGLETFTSKIEACTVTTDCFAGGSLFYGAEDIQVGWTLYCEYDGNGDLIERTLTVTYKSTGADLALSATFDLGLDETALCNSFSGSGPAELDPDRSYDEDIRCDYSDLVLAGSVS